MGEDSRVRRGNKDTRQGKERKGGAGEDRREEETRRKDKRR